MREYEDYFEHWIGNQGNKEIYQELRNQSMFPALPKKAMQYICGFPMQMMQRDVRSHSRMIF